MFLNDAVSVDVPCGAGLSDNPPIAIYEGKVWNLQLGEYDLDPGADDDHLGGWLKSIARVVVPIVGIVAAPFTAGTSLAVAGAITSAAAAAYTARQKQLDAQHAAAEANKQAKAQIAQQTAAQTQYSVAALQAAYPASQTRVTPSTGVAPFAPQAIAPFVPASSTTYASGYVPPPVGVALPGYTPGTTPGTTPTFAPPAVTAPYAASTNYAYPLPPGYPVPPGYPGSPQSRAPGVMAATAGLGMGNLPPWALPVMAAVGIILILTKGPPPPERAPDVH